MRRGYKVTPMWVHKEIHMLYPRSWFHVVRPCHSINLQSDHQHSNKLCKTHLLCNHSKNSTASFCGKFLRTKTFALNYVTPKRAFAFCSRGLISSSVTRGLCVVFIFIVSLGETGSAGKNGKVTSFFLHYTELLFWPLRLAPAPTPPFGRLDLH